jgi:beta-glucosidase-like glycosyl hydrolase
MTARLLFPAIRWDREKRSYDDFRPTIERGRELGVGGYIIFGGPAEAVADLTAELRAGSRHPLLIGADLERGAGQQFHGATALPPPAALAALGDPEISRRAGELTAREALAMGIDWVYAPVADLDLEPENPIVGSRAFGADPEEASRHIVAWIEGCRGAGALACAKHFPGHGRTTSDSHLQLPTVGAGLEALETDLVPFRRAIEAGVDSIMTAHVAYPALDASGAPATLSRPILTGLLRERLGYDGLVVTDALIMEGILEGGAGEAEAAVRAVRSGCDALLYPRALDDVAAALETARGGDLDEGRVAEALGRIETAVARVRDASTAAPPVEDGPGWGSSADREWAGDLARRCIRPLRGEPRGGVAIQLLTLDDDVGGPFPTGPRGAFLDSLREHGVSVREVDRPGSELPLVVALYADIKGFKGRPGLSATALERLGDVLETAPDATLVLFGHPRLAAQVPGSSLLGAWGGEPLMQEAAAAFLSGAPSRPQRGEA